MLFFAKFSNARRVLTDNDKREKRRSGYLYGVVKGGGYFEP